MPGDIILSCCTVEKNEKKSEKCFFLFVYFLVFKKMAYSSSLTHPQEGLPQPAINVLDIKKLFSSLADFTFTKQNLNHALLQ